MSVLWEASVKSGESGLRGSWVGSRNRMRAVSSKLIDISMWIDEFVFPGDEPVHVEGPINVLTGRNPEFVYHLGVPTQAGTHVQGPHYFLRDGATIDAVPLERFEGRAHVLDITKRGEDTTDDHLRRLLRDRRLHGEIAMLRTGHMDELAAGAALDPARRPGLSLEAARYLVEEQGVSMIAIDSIGVESRTTLDYDVNVYLCRNEVLILEGLVNLRHITASRVWLEAFPLKIRGVEGTPCRAVARQEAVRD